MSQQNVKGATKPTESSLKKVKSLYELELSVAADKTEVSVGTVVGWNIYGHGLGVVETVYGDQIPNHVYRIGGVLSAGGNARFDIVFEDGHKVCQLHESILRGVQWKIYDQIVPLNIVQRFRDRADWIEAKDKQDKARAKAMFSNAKENVKNNPVYNHLKPCTDFSAKCVSANIRADLKKEFKDKWPKVRFSVRTCNNNSINVSWEDGPLQSCVETLIRKYKNGSFDSMQDMYELNETPFNSVFGGVRYISAKRDYSDDFIYRALETFKGKNAEYSAVDFMTVENYRRGGLCGKGLESFDYGIQYEIRVILSETE